MVVMTTHTTGAGANRSEEFPTQELGFFTNSDPSDRRRFEAVVTYPRPVSGYQQTALNPSSTYTSIVYCNAYFSVQVLQQAQRPLTEPLF